MYELFGKNSPRTVVDLPANLEAFCQRLPEGTRYDVLYLINMHTLYRFYAPFIPPERREQIISDIRGDNGGVIHMRIGQMSGGLCKNQGLRFCPACIREDNKTYGEPYWHRVHQAPGVFVCPHHEIFLENDCSTCERWLRKPNPRVFHLLDERCPKGHEISQPGCDRKINASRSSDMQLLTIAKDIAYLLDNELMVDPLVLHDQYITILQSKDLATPSGRVRQADVIHFFKVHFSDTFMEYLGLSIDKLELWLPAILRKPRKAANPLYHLLVMGFLKGSGITFLMELDKTAYRPFGDGPWPCLNPVVEHYRQDVVKQCFVSRCRHTNCPFGTFSCECGFVYSRRGPDQSPEDKYRKGAIKSFGAVWESVLLRLTMVEKLTYCQIAKRMKADPATIKKHQKRLLGIGNISKHNQCFNVDLRENYRNIIQQLLKNPDIKTRTQVRQAAYKEYSWLYSYDRECLNSLLPSPLPRKKAENPKYKRVNWDERDNEFYSKIIQIIPELWLPLDGKLKRVTLSSVSLRLGYNNIPYIDKLPRTSMLIKSFMETKEEFQIRRVHFAIDAIRKEGRPFRKWMVLKKAGLSPTISIGVYNFIEDYCSRGEASGCLQ